MTNREGTYSLVELNLVLAELLTAMLSLDVGEPCVPRVAALLAVHLVSQVLDEAYVIANAADESGQPWRYLSMLKNLRSSKLGEEDDVDVTFVASTGDSDVLNEIQEEPDNVVATSTPQKRPDKDEPAKPKTENSLIGQGDEDFGLHQGYLDTTTSMFLNHLFDMSEVERAICDETQVIQNNPTSNDLLTQAMAKIMDSYVNTAFNIVLGQESQSLELFNLESEETQEKNLAKATERSCFSFLANAFVGDGSKDVAFYTEDELDFNNITEYEPSEVVAELPKVSEIDEVTKDDVMTLENDKKNDEALFENAYITMNRDFEQCSDDEVHPILQDPKGMTLQEVELMTASTSEDNLTPCIEPVPEERKEFAAISAVSAASRKSKTSLVSRCRSQGVRLLACIRGWWRRKAPGKRKMARKPGSIRGLCPLSPDARRRASSLLDQRHLCSPAPSRTVVWKFNTVNEALVHSSQWKEYSFEVKPRECDEF